MALPRKLVGLLGSVAAHAALLAVSIDAPPTAPPPAPPEDELVEITILEVEPGADVANEHRTQSPGAEAGSVPEVGAPEPASPPPPAAPPPPTPPEPPPPPLRPADPPAEPADPVLSDPVLPDPALPDPALSDPAESPELPPPAPEDPDPPSDDSPSDDPVPNARDADSKAEADGHGNRVGAAGSRGTGSAAGSGGALDVSAYGAEIVRLVKAEIDGDPVRGITSRDEIQVVLRVAPSGELAWTRAGRFGFVEVLASSLGPVRTRAVLRRIERASLHFPPHPEGLRRRHYVVDVTVRFTGAVARR